MAYRCKDLALINDNQYVYLIKQMNVAGIRAREPLDEQFQPSNPSVLGTAIKMLTDNRVQTKAQIEDAISLNLTDIEDLCGLEKGYLDQKVIPLNLRAKQTSHR